MEVILILKKLKLNAIIKIEQDIILITLMNICINVPKNVLNVNI